MRRPEMRLLFAGYGLGTRMRDRILALLSCQIRENEQLQVVTPY